MPEGDTGRTEATERFEQLFQQHEAALFRYIRCLTGDPSLTEDIYQETWLRVARHLRDGKKFSNAKSFLFTIATNIFRDELRRRRVRRFFLGPSLEQIEQAENLPAAIRQRPEQPEVAEALETALQKLTVRQRTMFSLSHVEGFSTAEISRLMSCAEGTVKATIFKAVQKLRAELREFRE